MDERIANNMNGWPLRPATLDDLAGLHAVFQRVVEAGDSYAFARVSVSDTQRYWFTENVDTWVCELQERVAGAFYLRPNQPDRGAHICNAGFIVDQRFRGRGLGRAMAEAAIREAQRLGYEAMQFNYVVSTNFAAIALWRSIGFAVVGEVPSAFRARDGSMVSAYIMHRFL